MSRLAKQRQANVEAQKRREHLSNYEIEDIRLDVQWFRKQYALGRGCILDHITHTQYEFYVKHLRTLLAYHNLPLSNINFHPNGCIIDIEFK